MNWLIANELSINPWKRLSKCSCDPHYDTFVWNEKRNGFICSKHGVTKK